LETAVNRKKFKNDNKFDVSEEKYCGYMLAIVSIEKSRRQLFSG
jgi:hypothetical protein